MPNILLDIIDRFVPSEIKKDPDLHVKGRLMVESCFLVLPICAVYFIIFVIVGNVWSAGVCIFGFVMAIYDLWDFSRRGNFQFSGNGFTLVSLIVVSTLIFTSSGLSTMTTPWVLMVPISGFLLVGIRSGIFWSVVIVILLTVLLALKIKGIELPTYVTAEQLPYVSYASLIGLLGYVVLTLLNNDLGRARVVQDLRRVKEDVDEKNHQITAINQALETTVAKRTEGLMAANEELDTFLYESSHALRRPLVRIIGLLNLLQLDISKEEHAKFMELIDYTAINMDTMLQDLILVSDVYQHEIAKQTIAIENEIDLVLEEMKVNKNQIQMEIMPSLNWNVDSALMKILLKKLLDNALFFKRDDINHQVVIRAYEHENCHIMEIEDNGMGIASGAKKDIFKMFSRATEKSRGSGLGLFIVRKIMDRLEGNVEIESELGSYTKVKIEF